MSVPLPIGRTELRNELFRISPEHRARHMAIFGASGVGKTTLFRNMAAVDLVAGHGLTVLDPHGSLAEDILGILPQERTNDLVYLDPQHPDRVLGINLLEPVPEKRRPLVVSGLVSALRNIWPEMWGPRLEDILANATFALLAQPDPVTLLAIPKLLTNETYRTSVLRNVRDAAIRSYFRDTFDAWPERFREEAISPVLNKVGAFIRNPILRAVIGQPRSSFDFRWLMDSGKILLANLSKGALGADVSSLLGSLLMTKLSLAALERQDVPEHERRTHFIYVDEVQNFIHGVDFPTLLGEGRKYAISFAIATQVLANLPRNALDAVFGNCATVMSFRVSGGDAKKLEDEFSLVVSGKQLHELPDYKLYVRTLVDRKPFGPYLVRAFPGFGTPRSPAARDRLAAASLRRYARPRDEVEANIQRFIAA